MVKFRVGVVGNLRRDNTSWGGHSPAKCNWCENNPCGTGNSCNDEDRGSS